MVYQIPGPRSPQLNETEEQRRRRLVLETQLPSNLESPATSGQRSPDAPPPIAPAALAPAMRQQFNTSFGDLEPQRIEPGVYGSYSRPQLPDDATPQQQARANINEIYSNWDNPRSFEKQGLWKRLGGGIVAGLRDWSLAGAPGGAWGALGAIGAGAALHGASPEVNRYDRRRMELNRLFGRYGQMHALTQTDLETQKQQFNLQGQILDQLGKANDLKWANLNQALKDPLLHGPGAKGYLTDADLATLKQRYGIDFTDPDNPQFVTERINGVTYLRPKNRPEFVQSRTAPVMATEVPVRTTSAITQTPINVTGPQLGQMEAVEAEADAARRQRTGEFNASATMDVAQRNIANLQKWHDDVAAIRREALTNAATVINQSVQARDAIAAMQEAEQDMAAAGTDTEELDKAQKKFDKAEREFQTAMTKVHGGQYVLDQLKQNLPPRPDVLQPATISPATRSQGGRNNNVGNQSTYQQEMQRIKRLRGMQ